MYINLPSKNHYRRPATYSSKGYRTRRMAVDFAVPLITNVKVAKLLFEALIRKLPLDVSPVDFKTSHQTYTFPGLINVAAFLPRLTSAAAEEFAEAAKASVAGGFATALVLPTGVADRIADQGSLDSVRSHFARTAYCNYGVSIAASASNVKALNEELQADVKSLFISYNHDSSDLAVTVVAQHFASWPPEKPIVTNAKGADLAPVLLLAGLHDRSVHVTDVQSKDDLLLISLSKAKNLKVSCDVSVYSLFFAREQFPGATCLPSSEDQKALWGSLDAIDVFSVGSVPYRLAEELGKEATSWSGVEETLPLLLTAVAEGRLTLKDVERRLYENPIRIFGLPDQANTHVEVIVGRRTHIGASRLRDGKTWSPLDGKALNGAVHRVLVHGQTVLLDGVLSTTPIGRDISSATISHYVDRTPAFGTQKVDMTPIVSHKLLEPIGTQAHTASINILGTVSTLVPVTAPTAPQLTVGGPVYGPPGPPSLLNSNFLNHPAFHRRHILSVKQFSHRDVHELFTLAHEMRLQVERNGTLDVLKGKVLATLFYEPSTRTSSSFDAAMKRCGGEVVAVNVDSSSVLKGETLPDTIRTLGCYADAIVIRHPDVGSSQLAAKFSPVPVINAGDGIGEHPTQVCILFYVMAL